MNLLAGSYDAAGNQLVLSPFGLIYDGENRVTLAQSQSNGVAAYDYDGEGQRVRGR
ncbi:MAG: hypothetical protein HY820_27995 [Acidobacteria bacterium]|nr:hypothetical protein [Acidobacteriota bacterium]